MIVDELVGSQQDQFLETVLAVYHVAQFRAVGGTSGEVCSTAGWTSNRQHLRRSSRADPASQDELLRWPVL